MVLRIGHGFDIHKFGGKRPLVIGGVKIPVKYYVDAYSDGDVMLHSLVDALLGAACNGDIGTLFPNTDIRYNNIDSRKLLRFSWKKIISEGYSLANVDISLILQYPMVQEYVPKMRFCIAEDLETAITSVNIKVTTAEGIGCIGRSEGVACTSIVLLLFEN